MSFRDLGVIELTVFAVLVAAFLLFFILFVILRHRKQAANNRRLLRKRATMEEAVEKKVRPVREKAERMGSCSEMVMQEEEYRMFAPPDDFRRNAEAAEYNIVREKPHQDGTSQAGMDGERLQDRVRKIGRGEYITHMNRGGKYQEEFAGEIFNGDEKEKRREEPLRMWDNNSKSLRQAKRSQQDPPFFVEERRISHRRDQLKRLEETK